MNSLYIMADSARARGSAAQIRQRSPACAARMARPDGSPDHRDADQGELPRVGLNAWQYFGDPRRSKGLLPTPRAEDRCESAT